MRETERLLREENEIAKFRSEISGPVRHLVARLFGWAERRYRAKVDAEAKAVAGLYLRPTAQHRTV